MIVAIADDITGAAEIAGIGLRYGLKTIVSPGTHFEHQPDLMVIYTNTRSMQQAAAVDQMKKLTSEARKLNPALFYKKTDSVLRGHVMAELEAQMKVMGCTKALLIPANPKMGRIITKGLYYVKDKPIIAITMGDPASIGPEIAVKALLNKKIGSICRPVIIGDASVFLHIIERLNLPAQVHAIKNISEAKFNYGLIDVYDLQNVNIDQLAFGEISAMAGHASFEAVTKAIELAMQGTVVQNSATWKFH